MGGVLRGSCGPWTKALVGGFRRFRLRCVYRDSHDGSLPHLRTQSDKIRLAWLLGRPAGHGPRELSVSLSGHQLSLHSSPAGPVECSTVASTGRPVLYVESLPVLASC